MRVANALRLYRIRLRSRLLQECFAIVGIAAGVALLFSSQVSNTSLQSSVGELSRGVVGKATLQLLARDPHGFPQRTLARVRGIPGVRVATPLLEVDANAIGPAGSSSVELIGAQPSLSQLGGVLVRHTALAPFGGVGAVVLPAPLAKAIGVTRFGEEVTLQLDGRVAHAPLYSQLHASQIGALIASPVAIAPLSFVQEMSGFHARVSRILVATAPTSEVRVRAALTRIAAGHLNVASTTYDERLFARAATASNRSTALFTTISALVGFLFAFNAMLLTVPQRRRLIADLRRDGYTPLTVIAVLLLDALMLGLIACALGLALGEELSIHVFHSNPAFLSLAFTVGSQRVVSWQTIAVATGGGMLAAIVAVLSPLREIFARNPLTAIGQSSASHSSASTSGGGMSAARPGRLALLGLICLASATTLQIASPGTTIPALVLLVGALLLALPLALSAALGLTRRLAASFTGVVPHVAAMELGAAGARALAVAATGAIAVFGAVTVRGSHDDLLAGLDRAARDTNASADLWIAPAGSYNLMDTAPFKPVAQAKLARLAGVQAVGLERGGLLDYGERRVLVLAPPPDAGPPLATEQIVQGNPRQAMQRVRAGGWLILSRALAAEQHLHIGQRFTLPSPDPRQFRLAALSTNLGWAPGAVIMNASDYARAWSSPDVSAYAIRLAPGASSAAVTSEVTHVLGVNSGLAVQSARRHAELERALDHQALANLTQIATLILIAAVLAMAAAIAAIVWQRRPRLAKLKLEGFPRVELWHTILLESLLLLGVGCAAGAIFGLYGQRLADHALSDVINFPVVYSLTALAALASLGLVTAAALAILAIPGYLAASVPAALALQD